MGLPVEGIVIHEESDPACLVTLDARHYPLIICDVKGTFTTAAVEFFFVKCRNKLASYAYDKGESIMVIMHMAKLRPPPATVRKAAGDHAAKDASTPGLLGTNIVVGNSLLRGVITAIVWIAGSENTSVEYANTLEEAIHNSLKSFETVGQRPPTIDPAAYTIPEPPRR